MSEKQRTQEIVPWDCIVRQSVARINEFIAKENGADELVLKCNVKECVMSETTVRDPEPGEMGVKVVGSICVRHERGDF